MVDYLPRSAWNARASEGRTSLVASRVDGIAVHWPGSKSSTPIGKDRVDDALRGWQDWHMDGRGWSDIAYQVAVDQWGRAWILRGLTVQSAANGNEDLNERYGALLLVLVKGEQPTAAMLSTARSVIADFQQHYPDGRLIKGHGEIRPDGTDCPGAATRAAIAAGKLTPGTEPPEDDMQLSDRINLKGEEAGRVLGLDSISVDGALGYAAAAYIQVRDQGRRIEALEAQERGRDADAAAADHASRVRIEVLFRSTLNELGVTDDKVDQILAKVNEEPADPA